MNYERKRKTKKFIILILCITMLISVFPTASFAAGNTTANAILMDDIYLNGFFEADDVTFDEDWYDTASNLTNATPWKDYMINGYKGTFDGKGHTIYGLYMANGNDAPAGFFNTISTDGTLKNVNFKGA